MAHTHQLNDNDTHFLIDAESRQITTNAKVYQAYAAR